MFSIPKRKIRKKPEPETRNPLFFFLERKQMPISDGNWKSRKTEKKQTQNLTKRNDYSAHYEVMRTRMQLVATTQNPENQSRTQVVEIKC